MDDAKFVGSSAGSLIGLALGALSLLLSPLLPRCMLLTALPPAALGLDFKHIRDFQLGCVDRTHGSLVGAFSLKQYVDEIMVAPRSQPPVCPRLSPPQLPSPVLSHASARVVARALSAGLHATRRRTLEDRRPRGGEPILSAWPHSRDA